ncbi:MAG: autotransporter assembly complex family protein [Paracoccus sp. (in: a-proteobacteria)]|uniref:autotransporter assembly complex protein TamA n=1 Tax=Paracoccus sp. TaxID=267 RepID=UPI0026E01615|nr:autotransporter assembly complex family protein [Paracoccus sp. (in: a-proteobacteria)]MDO5621002.1 autotransporter assembly complex family protein [Paracoccus sp. (in: a-proteobacteria)]
MTTVRRFGLTAGAVFGLSVAAAFGQSSGSGSWLSSPFSGLFGSRAESPVDLQIQIVGDPDGLENAIRNTSLIEAALRDNRFTGQDVLAAARGDYARILGALYDKGYYSGVINITLDGVEAAQIAPLDAPGQVRQVVIGIDPGPLFRFGQAEIAPLAPETKLPRGYAVGEVAGTGTIKGAASEGVKRWRALGYAKADVAHSDITAIHPDALVESQIALDSGPLVHFGRMHVSGNERLRTGRLYKIAGFPEGKRFDPEDIELVRKRLRRSGIFSAITLTEAETLNPDNSLDVDLTVVEQKKRRVGMGFEISTTDGAALSAYWMHRNLLGGGERLRVEASSTDIGSKNSERDDSFSIRLERPASFHPDITAYTGFSASKVREDDYNQDGASFAFGANYIRDERLNADVALEYNWARVYDANGRTDFRLLALPARVEWDQRDVTTDPTGGYWLSGQATPFLGFGDTGSGLRLMGEGRVYHGFGEEKRLVLAGRARIGTIAGSAIDEIPRDYLFYSGGGGSVRGQPYQSLGVEVIDSPEGPIKTGGMSLVNLSAEVRYRVRDKIGLAVFADAGKVWAEGSFKGDGGWQAGAGVGVRYITPIGPLRLDLAGPVGSNPQTGEGMQVYIGLGQAF